MADWNEEDSLKPIGPVDSDKCTAAGAGVSDGGYAGLPTSFVLTVKDSGGRKIPNWGGQIVVMVIPGVEVGGSDIDGVVMDQGDGTYSVTYVVPKIGNYMVNVECNGLPIMGSPFPVFFSAEAKEPKLMSEAENIAAGVDMNNSEAVVGADSWKYLANKPIVAVDPEKCTVAGPGVLGGYAGSPTSFVLTVKDSDGMNIPNWGGQIVVKVVPRVEVGGSDIDGVVMDQGDGTYSVTYVVPQIGYYMVNVECNGFPIIGSPFPVLFLCAVSCLGEYEKDKPEMLQRTVQVSNLVPNITAEQLKRVLGVRATIVECTITDPEHVAYIEYSKPEQAAIAVLALNNLELGGRLLKVEMAKSLPPKPATSSDTHAALSIERGNATVIVSGNVQLHCTRNATELLLDNHKHNQPDSSVNMIGTRAHEQPDGLPRDPLE